jgi:hypothetical protein
MLPRSSATTHDSLSDTGFWLDEPDVPWENPDWPWFTATAEYDGHADKGPLIKMVYDFNFEMTPAARLCIADLFSRYDVVSATWKDEKGPLIKMLLDFNVEVTPDSRRRIADLLSRYNLKRVSNRPRVPIYDLSDRELRLLIAKQAVHDKKQKMPRKKAIEAVARDFKISQSTLEFAVEGRHDGLRRKKKELERLKSYWLARVPDKLRLRPASR